MKKTDLEAVKNTRLSLLNKENPHFALESDSEDLVQEAFHLNVMMLTSIKSVVIKAHLNRI
jgi:hypothetical protein